MPAGSRLAPARTRRSCRACAARNQKQTGLLRAAPERSQPSRGCALRAFPRPGGAVRTAIAFSAASSLIAPRGRRNRRELFLRRGRERLLLLRSLGRRLVARRLDAGGRLGTAARLLERLR